MWTDGGPIREMRARLRGCLPPRAFLPDASWLTRFEARRQPPDEFCASLMRFCGAPVARETILLFTRGAKLLELKDAPDAEIAAYDRAVRQLAAVALRGGMDGGGLYALSLIDHMLDLKFKGGNIP